MNARLESVLRAAGFALTAVALVDAVRKRRTHGDVLGFLPYDFRPPSAGRVRRRLWQPDDDRVLMPTVFGVGWTPNLGRIARLLRLT